MPQVESPAPSSSPSLSLPLAEAGPAVSHGAQRCLSVDVEEYFHIEAAYRTIPRADWDQWPSRVEASVDLLLDLFARHGRPATFFILGHVAKRHPAMVRRIAQAGHEIASHGTGHDRLHRLTVESFREDLHASKALLEDLTGQQVTGYRAPTFSVTPPTAWAVDVLLDEGFTYDGSIFPVRHPSYGVPSAPNKPFMVQSRADGESLLELPPLTLTWGGKNLPVAGGGYFRLLPMWFMKRGLKEAAVAGRPAVLYFHPWEFDPGIPAMGLPLTGRLRTYTGLKSAARKLESIIRHDADWLTMAQVAQQWRSYAQSQPVFTLADAGDAGNHAQS